MADKQGAPFETPGLYVETIIYEIGKDGDRTTISRRVSNTAFIPTVEMGGSVAETSDKVAAMLTTAAVESVDAFKRNLPNIAPKVERG